MKNLLLVAGLIFLFAFSAAAQDKCIALAGIGQAHVAQWAWFDPNPENWYWGGPIMIVLGAQEGLAGYFAGQDGTDQWRGKNDAMGQGKGGSYTFGFNPIYEEDGITIRDFQDKFTTDVTNAVFPNPPGKWGLGFYQGAQKITSGTGRFENATGNILVSGTYGGFVASDGTLVTFWNPDVTGKICNVQPAP